MARYALYWNKVVRKTVLHEMTCGHYKKHVGKWEDTPNGGWYEDLSFEEVKEIQTHFRQKQPDWDHYSCEVCRPDIIIKTTEDNKGVERLIEEGGINLRQKVINFLKKNEGKTFRSPREEISRGKKPMQFTIVEFNEIKEKVKIRFESGTLLPLEFWRFDYALNYLQEDNFVPIGARISEDYPENSLEQILKEEEKRRYDRLAGTKTAPHIADLLTLAGVTELKSIKSETGRKVQGIKLNTSYEGKKQKRKSKYDAFWKTRMEDIKYLLTEANEKGKSLGLDVSDIQNWGERESWYGVVTVSKKRGIEKEKTVFVHIRSLARVIIHNHLLDPFKGRTFRIRISGDLQLVIEQTDTSPSDLVEFAPPTDTSIPNRLDIERRSFHCQMDEERHPATDSAYECEQCNRIVCANCFEYMVSTGLNVCPYCKGKLKKIQQILNFHLLYGTGTWD